MKIQKLVFQNINSLYGKWEINFDCDKFRQSGLFAITGKTGSGKSTILDAMTLALYGTTPRLSKGTIDAVSRGCHECMSELTFLDINGREWTATFAYEAFKRGSKKGTLNETAIHRLSCNGKTEAEKTTEVRKKVEEITGLDSTRFCRAVLLAQGSFDAFLNAGSDNGEILERITGTEIYSRIAAKLKERYDSEKGKLATLEAQCAGIQILPDEVAEEKRKEAAVLEKQIIELTEAHGVLNAVNLQFQQLELHRKNLETCKETENKLSEEETLFASSRKRLEEGKKALEADNFYRPLKELQHNQNVAETALQKAKVLLKEQEEICTKSEKVLEAATLMESGYQKEYEELSILLKTVRALDNTLQHLSIGAAEAAAKRRNATLSALEFRKELFDSSRKLAELKKSHSDGSAYLAAHKGDGELDAVQKLCSEWLETAKKLSLETAQNCRQEKVLKKELEKIQKNQEEKKTALKAEEKKFTLLSAEAENISRNLAELLEGSTKEHWQTLADTQEKCYHQALLLRSLEDHRKKLVPGAPCPLCGSREHPFAAEGLPEPEEENQALEKIKKRIAAITDTEQLLQKNDAAQKISANARKQLQETVEQLDSQAASKSEELSRNSEKLQSLQAEFSQTCDKISTALAPFNLDWEKEKLILPQEMESRKEKFARCKAAQELFEAEKSALLNTQLRLKTSFENQLRACRVCKKEQSEAKEKLSLEQGKRQALFGSKDPAVEEAAAEKKRKLLTEEREKANIKRTESAANRNRTENEIRQHEKNIAENAAQIVNAKGLFLNACKNSGLTEEMFHASVLEKEEMARLAAKDADLKARKQQLAENRKNCETAISELKEKLENQPAGEELQTSLETISSQIQEQNQLLGAIREKLKQDAADRLRMAEQHKKFKEQQKAMEVWTKMYDLIGSKDKFQRFAQGITLEHLLVLANLELAKLSDRYRLLRNPNEELGINVADKDQGDEIRSCKTLSGGERFLVSLSLALGLSQMAGEKIRVDSLFLDEGFGTLDSDTLEIALEALSSLRNRGKLVGVISHVTEFSDKIPCNIQVTKRGGGRSTIEGPGVRQL